MEQEFYYRGIRTGRESEGESENDTQKPERERKGWKIRRERGGEESNARESTSGECGRLSVPKKTLLGRRSAEEE